MKTCKQSTYSNITGLLFGLALLIYAHNAIAHGTPEVDNVPQRVVKASITQHADIEGLHAIILDAPRPGIMLRYQGNETLTVIGSDGGAFLRFTKDKVQVNINSIDWQELPNVPAGLKADDLGWTTLSHSGNYAWLDTRLNALQDAHHVPEKGKNWTIAIARENKPQATMEGELTFKQL